MARVRQLYPRDAVLPFGSTLPKVCSWPKKTTPAIGQCQHADQRLTERMVRFAGICRRISRVVIRPAQKPVEPFDQSFRVLPEMVLGVEALVRLFDPQEFLRLSSE